MIKSIALIAALAISLPVSTGQTPANILALDLTSQFPVGKDSLCKIAGPGEAIFSTMLQYDEKTSRWIGSDDLAIDGLKLPTPRIEETNPDIGETAITATIHMPRGTVWNGMPLAEITSGYLMREESDGYDWRSFTFNMPASALQSKLLKFGYTYPISPGYRVISDDDAFCPSTVHIKDRGKQSIMQCGTGC